MSNMVKEVYEALVEAGASQEKATKAAEVLAHEFIRADATWLATKDDIASVRTEIADLRTELKGDIASVRTEIADLRTELKGDIAGLRVEMADKFNLQLRWITGAIVTATALLLIRSFF